MSKASEKKPVKKTPVKKKAEKVSAKTRQELTLKKRAMIEALEKTLGIVTQAAKMVNISRMVHYDWLKEDAEYAKAVEDINDIALDFAETALYRQIRENNTASTIFYLKTKGRNRGYVERVETQNETTLKADPVVEEMLKKVYG